MQTKRRKRQKMKYKPGDKVIFSKEDSVNFVYVVTAIDEDNPLLPYVLSNLRGGQAGSQLCRT